MTKQYPSWSQMKHDAGMTLLSSLIGSLMEIALCHLWSNGMIKFDPYFKENFWFHLFCGATVSFWRKLHFYAIHRLMHPWRTESIPDLGKYLYRKVHSLHHKSHNPTAFSGTSMHPVESTLYYTAIFLPCLWAAHPIVALTALYDLGIAAWLGHDGFQWPGSGDYYHQLLGLTTWGLFKTLILTS